MAMWHLIGVGFGLGLLATFLTILANQRQHRKLTQSSESSYFSPPGESCAICLHDMTNDEMNYLNCGHAFHRKCLNELRRHHDNKCPTCRTKI